MVKPYLADRLRTQAVLNAHRFMLRKKYGQNFLIDPRIPEEILAAAGITKEDFVLEIGPGIGTLTQYLAYAGRGVCAVEIDEALRPILEDTLADYPNAEVLWGDVLKTDIGAVAREKNEGRPMKVCANLPYYITSPILMHLLESDAPISSITVMVQKEVADRMVAEAGSKAYGSLSLAVQYYTKPVIACPVPPCSFVPPPKVESAVIHLEIAEEPAIKVKDRRMLFSLIRASFNERRKTLQNGIADYAGFSFSKGEAGEALRSLGLDERIRGEKLGLAEFAALADVLTEMRAAK